MEQGRCRRVGDGSLTYTITDGIASAQGQVTFTITQTNTAPVAVNDSYRVHANQVLNIAIAVDLANKYANSSNASLQLIRSAA